MPVNLGFRKVMMEKVEDVALVFFLPLFFAFTGLRTEIGLINTPELWGICALLIFIAILGKLGGCTIAARLVGESWKDSFTLGTLMNTRGLMELIALNIGYEMGVLPPEIFVILILMALSTTFMTTPLLKLADQFFKHTSSSGSVRPKLILSFGRPESGRHLLALVSRLWGQRLENMNIIATHYTIGTDLNPEKASQYARDSFKPLDRLSAQLHLDVDKRYKVTDRLVREIQKLNQHEKPDMLLLGAGPQFMQYTKSTRHESNIPIPIKRLFHQIQKESLRLPGGLLKDKLQDVIEKTEGPVSIFVNRNNCDIQKLFLYIGQEKELFLIDYLRQLWQTEHLKIRICYSLSDQLPVIQKKIAAGDFEAGNLLNNETELYQPDSLLILSYDSCLSLARNPALFKRLPSLFVLHLNNGQG